MAPQIQDITGKQYGRLTVLSYAGKLNGKPYWNCLCKCGAMKTVMGQSLRQGKTKSCGCQQYTNFPTRAKPGDRYGRMTVIERAKPTGFWLCQCDCGRTKVVKVADLRNGHTTSCGCFRLERVVAAKTTHGLSRTPAYLAMKARERLERKREMDINWTIEMDVALRRLQQGCVLCKTAEDLTVDHLLPLSKGHGLRPGNAVILCGSCNSHKFNKLLEDLPPDVAEKLVVAAGQFKLAWEVRT